MRCVAHLLRVDRGRADPVSKAYFHVTPRHEVQHLGGLGDKSQAVRLADVFIIGPVMVMGGARLGGVLGNVLAAPLS